jgi:ribosomal protein L34
MTDFGYFTDQIAAHQIRERIATKQGSRVPGARRHPSRHAFARGLHHLAERLDR